MAGELTYGYGHFIQINLDRRMETLHAVGHSFSSCTHTRTILGPTTVHCVAVIDAFIASHAPKCAGSDDVLTSSNLPPSLKHWSIHLLEKNNCTVLV